jgi:hypothetical protein
MRRSPPDSWSLICSLRDVRDSPQPKWPRGLKNVAYADPERSARGTTIASMGWARREQMDPMDEDADRCVVPWYHRDDYPKILRIMADSDLMPSSYEAWLECARSLTASKVAAGCEVIPCYVEPAPFLDWCHESECSPDCAARLAYVEELDELRLHGLETGFGADIGRTATR